MATAMKGAIAAITSTNLGIQALGAISGILLARLLGPEGRGELATVILWPSIFAAVFLFGTDSEISRRAAISDWHMPLTGLAVRLSCILGSVGIALGIWVVPLLLPGDKQYLVWLSRWMLLVIPLSILNVLLFSVALGRGRYDIYNISRMVFSPVYIVFLGALAISGKTSLEIVALAYLSTAVMSALFSMVMVSKAQLEEERRSRELHSGHVIASAIPFAVSSLVQTACSQLPQILAVVLLDTRAVGLFVIAMTVGSAHQAFGTAFAKTIFSRSAKTSGEAMDWFAKSYRCGIVIYICFAMGMFLVAPPLIPYLFGEAFGSTAKLIYWLIPATTAVAMSQVMDHVLRGRQSVRPGIIARMASAVVMSMAALVLVPDHQLIGLCMAIVISTMVEFIVIVLCGSKVLGIPIGKLLGICSDDLRTVASAVNPKHILTRHP